MFGKYEYFKLIDKILINYKIFQMWTSVLQIPMSVTRTPTVPTPTDLTNVTATRDMKAMDSIALV